MKYALITTTIFVPKLLAEYVAQAKAQSITDLTIVVIGDLKTPAETQTFCEELGKTSGYTCEYYSPDQQVAYLSNQPELLAHLTWNSIMRRNIGILRGYELGADVIITIDDDNFIADKNYFEAFDAVAQETSWKAVASPDGWFNVCSQLVEERGTTFFHRGYPTAPRTSHAAPSWGDVQGKAAIVAGFWMEEPDIDAAQRLACPVRVTGCLAPERFVLSHDTWSPFNSQNTGIRRDVVPAYFLSPYIGRYDDIWASYIVTKIAHHLKDYIAFGRPIVRQDRNPHNYFKDFDAESVGMQLTDRVCLWLRSVELTGNSYADCFKEILNASYGLLDDKDLTQDQRRSLIAWMDGCRIWSEACRRIG